jgi:beta-glucosidase
LADVVILCLGLSPAIEGEEGDAMNSDAGGDRTRIELPDIQEKLLDAVKATGTPIVVVLISGSALSTGAAEKAGAIVQLFYPGQEGGAALADVLFGDHNPSGRLPVTFYNATSDLPAFSDYSMDGRTYRYYRGPVLYPFGFGLSYTRFQYSELTATSTTNGDGNGQSLAIGIVVKNRGEMAGDEIVQVYVEHLDVKFRKPIRQLVGLRRVRLLPGKSKRLKILVGSAELEIVDEAGNRIPARGAVRITVAGSQNDSRSLALGATPGLTTIVKF